MIIDLLSVVYHEQVLFGLEYTHAMPEIKKELASNAANICGSTSMLEFLCADASCSALSPSGALTSEDQVGSADSKDANGCLVEETSRNFNIGGLRWRLPQGQKMEDYSIIWIGPDNTALGNIGLTFNGCEIGKSPD